MSYWRNRELNHIKQSIENDERIARRIRRNQQRAKDDIETQIEAFYGRYADVEGISMSEARKRVSKLDVKKYSDKAQQYVKERNFSKMANEQMRVYNVTMNVNRLELLKANIHLELLAMTSEEQRVLFEEMSKSARAEYERQAGILGETLNFNEKNIASIVNSSFLTAKWSDRLWDNQDALRSELDRLLNRSIVQGRNPREMARELRKTFNTSIFNSERLLITETARVQQDVFQDSMKQAEIGQYEYIAEMSACDICAALDGKIFDVDDAEAGRNAYPMHPFCKCSQAAYVDRESLMADFDERGLYAEDDERLNPQNKYNDVNDVYESVNLRGMNKDYREDIEDRLVTLQNDYPIAEDLIRVTNTKSNSAYGWYQTGIVNRKVAGTDYVQFERRLNFSNTLMKNAESSRRLRLQYPKKLNDMVDGTRGLMVIDHEYAHAIDYEYILVRNKELKKLVDDYVEMRVLTGKSVRDANAINTTIAQSTSFGDVVKDRMMKDLNVTDSGEWRKMVKEEFGDYANSNIKEFLAEGFSIGRHDKNPSEFTKKFMEHFNAEYNDTFGR